MCTPVGRLSDEMILRILECCEDELKYHILRDEGAKSSPAFLLCRRWRNIAIHSASLWTHISLPMPSALFALFCNRSRHLPLRVYIKTQSMPGEKENYHRLGSFLLQILPRIAHLRVDWSCELPEAKPLNAFLAEQVGQREWSALTLLEVEDVEGDSDPHVHFNAPQLRILRYEGQGFSVPYFSKDSIVNLRLNCPILAMDDLLDVLSRLPRLKQCSVVCVPDLDADDEFHRTVSLPELRRLSFGSIYVSQMSDILEHLILPPQCRMDLSICEDSPVQASFGQFIAPYLIFSDKCWLSDTSDYIGYYFSSKSDGDIDIAYHPEKDGPEFEPLRPLASHANTLTFIDLEIQSLPFAGEVRRILDFWIHVKHIGIHTGKVAFQRFLEAFAIPPNGPCPRLESFDCTETKFCTNHMNQFLTLRLTHGSPLKKLTFTKRLADAEEGDVDYSLLVKTIQKLNHVV
ncbi:hypothetical protein SISSUDRAFT_1131375 [Sistotremastrum suecicum HHB10207 ss-3]|uniref:F-box domain-containing protein n=1 Tax=Sistotremastrum suecicum HHB10207 ss-3 TaxID=1314776 RepID=A0A166A924_9AGAM|nr:hypothetical protein SISSUDRAFT_1131375 [Sistotremastrum suecicum HHB10207 ss-3]